MSNKVSFVIQLKNQFSANAQKIKRSMAGVADNTNKSKAAFAKLKTQARATFPKIKSQAESLKKSMTSLGKSISLKVGAPLVALGGVSVRQSAKLESLAVSFETMTGSAEAGNRVLKDLVNFTAKTPFQIDQVCQAACGLWGDDRQSKK